ncbi:MAG: hypothetical protein ABIJ47_06880 [Candidatus Bathyarchaeota archaeon]
MIRSFEAAVGWIPERICGECSWIRDYCGRQVCYHGGQVGRTVRGDEDATFCEGFEEADL